ncbi:MAG: transcription elongation factor GreA [Gammaproteobacteria bacterium]|nr:transcription elongation factor GreA [Gammaproteobacteria bacterium]
MSKVALTVEGAKRLREELKKLKTEDRPRVIKAIAEARAHGDLKENAEYHAAKDQQGFIEGRIKNIDGKLSHAQIIDVTELPNSGRVVFGTTVDLVDKDSGEKTVYQIVGEDEADIRSGRLSYSSPIARALIGKEAGDVVDVRTPGGDRSYEITKVRYV